MGVIALITVPIIKDTIEKAKEKNFKNSAIGIIEAANEYYLNSKLTGDYFEEIEFKVNNGKMVSGDKELSFNGKVPVGDSYVKIKSNGDVAINITDGEYYAVKDYDEVGASIGTSEESALLREELAKKVAELEKIVNDNKKELDTKIEDSKSELETKIDSNKTELASKIENNTTNIKTELASKIENNTTNIKTELTSKINNNTNSISNLTNKENSNNIFLKTYPVGSIYISTSNINPSTIYGGTWERYGQGKTLVGLNENETEFSTVNKTGGEKSHTLSISEMPSHNHSIGSGAGSNGRIIGLAPEDNLVSGYNNYYIRYGGVANGPTSYINTYNVGGSSAHNNLQPYITVYMWKRTS